MTRKGFFIETHPCDKPNKGGCQQICSKKGDEAECECDEGFKLAADGKSCDKGEYRI